MPRVFWSVAPRTRLGSRSVGTTTPRLPTSSHEFHLLQQGNRHIAGVDEAGRGAWAGPLTASAVILPPVAYSDNRLFWGVTDSKRLSPAARTRWADLLHARAIAVGVAHVTPREIDDYGLSAAGRMVMSRALSKLCLDPDHVILDAFALDSSSPFSDRQTPLVRADSTCLAVAAASICAKVARDGLMRQLHRTFPEYGFDRHKGYGTPHHRAALNRLGRLPIHRRSFAPVRNAKPARCGSLS